MTYQGFYGEASTMSSPDRHFDERVVEHFSTEHEALRRARELLDEDISTVVAVCDRAGSC